MNPSRDNGYIHRLRRLEIVVAKVCAITLIVALASGGIPDHFFDNGLIVALLTTVAGLLLFSWLFLFFFHLYRILVGRWDYSFVKIFVVLFVPVVGVVWLSIKGVPERSE